MEVEPDFPPLFKNYRNIVKNTFFQLKVRSNIKLNMNSITYMRRVSSSSIPRSLRKSLDLVLIL